MSENGNTVELRDVAKRYGDFTALQRSDLSVPEGSFVTFVGPSGCGKTTTLRMIAGLAAPSEGDILIRGRRINDVPIHQRNLGLVFQNYALFPHKSVFDNIAFGLKYRKVAKGDITRRVREALELVRLPKVEDRLPSQLSGGQQQRIALARAIVIEPDVLLLDEPLSALDANLREEMRVELKHIQRELGIATIFVTHDQSEALALSDKVVVMNQGSIEQTGTPEEVYNDPTTEFVAAFLGHSNILPGQVARQNGGQLLVQLEDNGPGIVVRPRNSRTWQIGDRVQVVIRAERVLLADRHEAGDDHTILDARVDAVDYQGQAARYFVTAGNLSLQAINPIDHSPFSEGTDVQLRIRDQDCVLLGNNAA